VVNGAHTAAVFQTHIGTFVTKFVLCPKCGLPETKLVSGSVRVE
jgi:translation initiation factor 2 beta subunit (eIF-2beta)/eIF-5